MNVYDFDNTIYDGESVIDFYLFLAKKRPSILKFIPKILFMLAKYKMCRVNKEQIKAQAEKYAAILFNKCDNIELLVEEFWDKHQSKIKAFYLELKREDDVILSANASFLLCEMTKRLGVKTLLSSELDIKNGQIKRLCFGDNKVKVFREYFPENKIDNFYTDSMVDKPLFGLCNKVYIVKGDKIKEYKTV